jgi:hypothetical protein
MMSSVIISFSATGQAPVGERRLSSRKCFSTSSPEGEGRIVDRGPARAPQQFVSKIGVRFQVAMLAQDHEDRSARVGEHAALDQIEQLFGQAGGQANLEAQPALAGLLRNHPSCAIRAALASGSAHTSGVPSLMAPASLSNPELSRGELTTALAHGREYQ